MIVAVLYGDVPEGASEDEQDVLVQVEVVTQSLLELGYTPVPVPLSLDLAAAANVLKQLRPGCVFNLVETVQGCGRYIHLGPTLLEGLCLPYTGASTAALLTTSNKLLSKKILVAAGVPTPPWLTSESVLQGEIGFPGPYMIKSVWEHASIGLDDEAVIAEPACLEPGLRHRRDQAAAPWFIERYVPGREFNLSLLAGRHGPELLPPAEIDFMAFPLDKPRIVGYRAKWDNDSFEYRHTVRRFDFSPAERPLLERLAELAMVCWHTFDLRGYARVDLRIDEAGQPWILEVNANPCLAPDSGFVAAAARAGWRLSLVIERIIADIHPAVTCRPATRGQRPQCLSGDAA